MCDETVHFGMPLVEYRLSVWIIANQDCALSDKRVDMLIGYCIYAFQNPVSTPNWDDDYKDA
jgi:hypothetical protein